jgi:hypothetical protein
MIESNNNNAAHRASHNNTIHRSSHNHDISLAKQTNKQTSRDFNDIFTSLDEEESDIENHTEAKNSLEKSTDMTAAEPQISKHAITHQETKGHNNRTDEKLSESDKSSEKDSEETNQNKDTIGSSGIYIPANTLSDPLTANTPIETTEKPALDTQKLIDQLCTLAKTLINKAEVCIDKENKTFSIAILDSFLKDTEITLSNKDGTTSITIRPSTADQYQFLQKEKETLRKKIKENNNDVNIDILIDEP